MPKKGKNSGIQWYFPSTDHGEDQGFADPILEFFQGDHERYIAREAIQNAVDARLDNNKPVRVFFERFQMPVGMLPDKHKFASIIGRCARYVAGQDKAELFFRLAADLLKGEALHVLKISDFNTRGLSGADKDKEGNWYRLVRATGTSSPKGVMGGSFGIGKGAPIAASALHTVFYSSISENGGCVFQGKARLVSHLDEKNDTRQGVGFCGAKDGHEAVRELEVIPEIFRRTERGTDIYIIGYEAESDWEERLIKSLLSNFWLAILHGDLEICVKDGSEINIVKENLKERLDEYDAGDARAYFDAVTNPTLTFESGELKHLGKVQLFVKKNESYPSRVMFSRKPKMIVFDRQYRVLRGPYAAVFLCDNDKGNKLLRDLEPPAHDKWDKDRAKNGWAALREMDDFIKSKLKSMGDDVTSEPEDIPGLDRYLPESDEKDYQGQRDADSLLNPTELFSDEESGREIGAVSDPLEADVDKVIRKGVITNKEAGTVKATPPDGIDDGVPGRATGERGGEKDGVRINTAKINFRSFILKSGDGIEYRLAITGKEDCKGGIRLIAVGDDGNYPVSLASVADAASGMLYEIESSLIKGLDVKGDSTLKLAVRLNGKSKYSLGIENYEN